MTKEDNKDKDDGLLYQTGFGNTFESSALPGSLPKGRNNPKKVPYDLFTEQISGTAFTAPRATNLRTWLYRIHPSTQNGSNYTPVNSDMLYPKYLGHVDFEDAEALQLTPNPLRWKPNSSSNENKKMDFIAGLQLLATTSRKPVDKDGLSIYMYGCNLSMTNTHFVNADGDFLIVPQHGTLKIITELGQLQVEPQEICIVPRGFVFSVQLLTTDDTSLLSRGYVLEIHKGHFQLPELGPIGSNGLANGRDFQIPTAWFVSNEEQYNTSCTMVNKFGSQLFQKQCPHSPFNVVAWHGNYTPYKYDLRKFCVVNSVSYDHLDPSIYTVLTCAGNDEPGTALADFVIFPPRTMATDSNTFRPPWYHRNCMTEFMGLICGSYDAKTAFQPGGASLHSCMTPHGPDTESYHKAVAAPCDQPTYFDGGMAFMFETSYMLYVSKKALMSEEKEDDVLFLERDVDYEACWQGLDDVSNAFFSKLKSNN